MLVEMKNVVRRFGDIPAVDGGPLAVARGEVVVIIGPSGSGKSTLLRCLNALEEIQSGEIVIDGLQIDRNHRKIHQIRLEVGMVFLKAPRPILSGYADHAQDQPHGQQSQPNGI